MVTLGIIVALCLVAERYRPLVERLLVVHERRFPVVTPPSDSAPIEVPHDIVQQALQWSEEYARAQHLARARELYEESGDWVVVRDTLAKEAA